MKRIRYQVACSLDGYIAAADGSYDWIPADPEIDFGALFAQFDTLLMGRRTWEVMAGSPQLFAGMDVVVLSDSLRPEEHPHITVLSGDVGTSVQALREREGKDIWLFGGGETFRRLLAFGLVDTVEPAVVPVLLGGGIPLLPAPSERTRLRYRSQRVYPGSGIVLLEYDVAR